MRVVRNTQDFAPQSRLLMVSWLDIFVAEQSVTLFDRHISIARITEVILFDEVGHNNVKQKVLTLHTNILYLI